MDILKEIIALDKAAVQRVEQAVNEQTAAMARSDKQAEQKREEHIRAERKKLEDHRAAQEKILAEKRGGVSKAEQEQFKRLDEIFAAHGDKWQNEIFKRVTGV